MSQDIYRIYFGLRDGRELHADLPVINGEDGSRGTGILKVTTAPSSYTTATGGFTPTYRIALSTVKNQAKVSAVLVGDTVMYSYYHYPVGYVDTSYVYLGARNSIRGSAGAAGAPGTNGTDGYTPLKGVDYYTAADQESIVQQVIAALGTPVFGRVTSDKTITLTAHGLPDGTYTFRFENEDGTLTDIGTVVKGEGDESDSGYTNLIETVGYEDGKRLSGSSGTTKDQSGCVTTGFIPITAVGDVFRTSGVNFDDRAVNSNGWCYMGVYNDSQGMLAMANIVSDTNHASSVTAVCDSNGNLTITVDSGATVPGYIRLSGVGSGANLIVTKNQPITGTTYTNVIPLSTDANGNPYNGGLGYREGYRYSNSGGGDVVGSGLYTTGYIKCNGTDTLYFKNVGMNKDAGVANGCHMYLFTALDAASTNTIESAVMTQYHSAQWDANGNIVSLKVTSSNTNSDYWVRFNTTYLGPDSIITINEPIADDDSSTTYTNLFDPATAVLNTRMSGSTSTSKAENGYVMTATINIPSVTVYETANDSSPYIVVPEGMWSGSANIFMGKGSAYGVAYMSINQTAGTTQDGWTKIPLSSQWGGDHEIDNLIVSLFVKSSAITTSDIQNIQIYFNESPV